MTTTNMLTTTLYGWTAVYYAKATGGALHRAEVRRALGVIEQARFVTPQEATLLLQSNQTESAVIWCDAAHGERPYRGAGPVEIDWPAIHAAALVVDWERGSHGAFVRLGYESPIDAFGGSYFPATYERDGLAGVVRLLEGAHMIRRAAWEAVHRAHGVTHGHALAARALRTTLALDHLYRALAAVGVYVHQPATQICGVTGYTETDTVQVTGLRWLAGHGIDDAPPTITEVRAVISAAEVA